MPKTLLVIVAHPDDESFGIGGTMARCAEEGHHVTVVCATRGEVGEISDPAIATPETLGAVREQELRTGMRILGVEDVRFLEYRDSGMAGTPENADPRSLEQASPEQVSAKLLAIMNELQPDTVITWDASGGYGHPDHIKVHQTATAAFHQRQSRDGHSSRLYWTALPTHLFEEMAKELQAKGIEFGSARLREDMERLPRLTPTAEIDVSPYMERKRQALAAHRSQMQPDSPFDKLSDGLRLRFFGREYFHRAVPPVQEGEEMEKSVLG